MQRSPMVRPLVQSSKRIPPMVRPSPVEAPRQADSRWCTEQLVRASPPPGTCRRLGSARRERSPMAADAGDPGAATCGTPAARRRGRRPALARPVPPDMVTPPRRRRRRRRAVRPSITAQSSPARHRAVRPCARAQPLQRTGRLGGGRARDDPDVVQTGGPRSVDRESIRE